MSAAAGRFLGLVLMSSSIVLSAVGQLFMKAGMQSLHAMGNALETPLFGDWANLLDGPIPWTVAGLTAYVCSLVAWLAVLVRYPLSIAYPMLSLSYVLVYIGATSWAQIGEDPTALRTAGTLLILAGVGLVSRTNEPDQSVT